MLYSPKWELDETSCHLLDAANYMEQYGWCRMAFQTKSGAVCPGGAIYFSANDRPTKQARDRLASYLHRDPGAWNDYVCKDKAQAVAVLRAAATSKY